MYRKLYLKILGFMVGLGLMIIPALLSPWFFPSPREISLAQEPVKLLDNLGDYHYPISTKSKLAQKYFEQGLILAYGFNHAEATRAFQAGIKLDPDCAMCHWGLAYVKGPNINAPMTDEQVTEAWQALQQAIAVSKQAPKKEQAYIQALAQRYRAKPLEDRSALDLAYAQGMQQIVQNYPDDLDAATLYAEAVMDTMPWDYWQDNGELKPEAEPVVATLESVLKVNPQHPGANHLYIHVTEKERPQLAVQAADNLRDLVPAAGHLVHMPSHIYIRVGRYQDAVIANQKAIVADQQYLASPHPQSIYTIAYVPHNHHFLWFAALMSGQSQIALEAAQQTAAVDANLLRDPDFAGALQHFSVIPLYTQVRFGQWTEILKTPAPETDLKYPTGVWHYARGMAFAAQGQQAEASQELAKLQALTQELDLAELKIWGFNSTADVLKIASEVLTGSIAKLNQDYSAAITHLQQAIALEDSLVYTEPPDWYSPTRNLLGEILLEANRPEEAEQAFRADLTIYPDNGWSLHGLFESLEQQNKQAEAETVKRQYEQAWQYADIVL